MFNGDGSGSQIAIRLLLQAIFWLGLGWGFFRKTHGRGKISFGLFVLLFSAVFYYYPSPVVPALAVAIFLVSIRGFRSREKESYVPIVARVEGGGVKRGLTAAEAGILLGLPFSRSILSLVFGLLKKGVLVAGKTKPLELRIASGFQVNSATLNAKERTNLRKRAAAENNMVITPMEEMLMEFLEGQKPRALHEHDFQILLQPFLDITLERLGGYDLEATREYYRSIIRRAHTEVRVEGKLVDAVDQVFERNFPWIVLNPEYRNAFAEADQKYQPAWLFEHPPEGLATWLGDLLDSMHQKEADSHASSNKWNDRDPAAARLAADIHQATYFS